MAGNSSRNFDKKFLTPSKILGINTIFLKNNLYWNLKKKINLKFNMNPESSIMTTFDERLETKSISSRTNWFGLKLTIFFYY